jgi:hypothetical protein
MRSALGRSPLAGDRRDGLGLSVARKRASYRSRRGNVISADSTKLIERKTCRPKPMRSALGRSPLAGDRRDGLGLSVARKRAPTGPGAAMSSLPTAPSSSIERRADQNPCARHWVGARLRATVAMASGSPSPASGLLPVPARQCHLCRQHQAHRSKDVARPWVGARLRATAAIHGVRRYRLPNPDQVALGGLHPPEGLGWQLPALSRCVKKHYESVF